MKIKVSDTGKDLILGILGIVTISSIGGGILANVFFGGGLPFVFGNVFGGGIAIALALHMDATVNTAVDLGEKEAVKYARKKSVIRYILMVLSIFIVLTFPQFFNIIGLLLGILALKFSAYLQPVTSKYITNKNK